MISLIKNSKGVFLYYLVANIVMLFLFPFIVMLALVILASIILFGTEESSFLLSVLSLVFLSALPNLLAMLCGMVYAHFRKQEIRPHVFWGTTFILLNFLGQVILFFFS